MSNLTLPRMTYTTLSGMLSNALAKGRYGALKLAYETTAERAHDRGTIIVRHHGNPIAEIGPDFFTLSGSGWNSRTTADRLNTILHDNQTTLADGFEREYYTVSSRDNKREYGLFLMGTTRDSSRTPERKTRNIRDIQSNPAHFSRVNSDAHYILHGE